MDRRTFLEALGVSSAALARARGSWDPLFSPAGRLVQDDGAVTEEIALFGVASDGTIEQWDGHPTPVGILLRWFEPGDVGFPDYGYDVYRARVPGPSSLPLSSKEVREMTGEILFSSAGLVLEAPGGLTFRPIGPNAHALVVAPGAALTARFEPRAWYVRIATTDVTSLVAQAYAGDVLRVEHDFSVDGVVAEWTTPGIERIEFVGTGEIKSIDYALVTPVVEWTHLVHLCLPIRDPAYPCAGQWAGTDEDEARRRLPAPVQAEWATRYGPVFHEMYPTIQALARGQTPPPFPPPADPSQPSLTLDPTDALALALLDPHVARILGAAWDDPLQGRLDGQAYAYKVIGRWRRQPSRDSVTSLDPTTVQAHGLTIEASGGSVTFTGGVAHIVLAVGGRGNVIFPTAVEYVSVRLSNPTPVTWRALSAEGAVLGSGQIPASQFPGVPHNATITAPGMRQLEAIGPASMRISRLEWRTTSYVDRVGLLPGILASEPGAPQGPSWVSAAVRQPGGTAGPIEAAVDWEVDVSPTGVYGYSPTPFYQVGGVQASTDPAAPRPADPAFDRQYLLVEGDFIVVPPALAAAWPPRELLLDRENDGAGLKEGWRCWWARGIDLFGRVSAPSGPYMTRIEDTAPPPAPILLLGEYAQADLAALQAGPAAQSTYAQEWLVANPTANAFVVAWAWTPELEAQCGDVDGFRVFARRPVAVSGGGPLDPTTTSDSVPWGSPLADLGATPVRFDGQVTSVAPGIPGPIAVNAVNPIEGSRWSCSTDLALQVGGGALVGANLVRGGSSYSIIGHGEGSNVTLFVDDVTNAGAPVAGTYAIDPGTSDVVKLSTDISQPADPAVFKRRIAGAVLREPDRFLVLHAAAGSFVCRTGGVAPPVPGDRVTWYPAYAFAFADTGQGPQPSATEPVAYGQLNVRSVRRWSSRPVESPPAVPASIVAVDATVPATPVVPTPAAGDYCAVLATRADWYGISRYTLNWPPDPALRYVVYRAMGEAIMRLDLEEHTRTSSPSTHTFPQEQWISEIWNEGAHKQLVLNDLTALDAALPAALALPAGSASRRNAIAAAYAALHSDTQRIIAYQPYARPAYSARNGTPLDASQLPFTDEFDGRARARWFYRIASRTLAGVEGEWTPPTPPICAPDVVPPTPPQVQVALADNEKVKLRWIVSPEPDVAKCIVFRAGDEVSAADVRTMQQVAQVAAAPTANPPTGLESPSAVSGKSGWLEYSADPTPAGEWFFRLVAEDEAGNRWMTSKVLRGRSIKPLPAPPVWGAIERLPAGSPDHVDLSWTHPSDQRLSCLVERTLSGMGVWTATAEWLPRGVYQLTDSPPRIAAGWEYRLRVRDDWGQTADSMPVATLSALP